MNFDDFRAQLIGESGRMLRPLESLNAAVGGSAPNNQDAIETAAFVGAERRSVAKALSSVSEMYLKSSSWPAAKTERNKAIWPRIRKGETQKALAEEYNNLPTTVREIYGWGSRKHLQAARAAGQGEGDI